MTSPISRRLLCSCLLLLVPALAYGQKKKPAGKPDTKKKVILPKIADTPETVDPATLIPKNLAAKATIDFTDTSLKLIAKWIQDTQKITVLFDDPALSKAGIPQSELVTDHLKDEPVYLLLNRLSTTPGHQTKP